MAKQLIDRIGEMLLIEAMSRGDLCNALHEQAKSVADELWHLRQSGMVMTRTLGDVPIYVLTSSGKNWALSGRKSVNG